MIKLILKNVIRVIIQLVIILAVWIDLKSIALCSFLFIGALAVNFMMWAIDKVIETLNDILNLMKDDR